jgi:glucose-6-phosphate dehydrogenase assembly protein OpcA
MRRITDAMGAPDPIEALEVRARNYCPGDTDLTWTRLTRWRGLLAASLDAFPMVVDAVEVRAAPGNAAGHLLGAWLGDRLGLPVRVDHGGVGRGINFVVLSGADGEIRVARTDGNLAVFAAPGLPERVVALPRRDLNTLLAEELRRLDDDLIYAESMAALVRRLDEREQRLDEREQWEQKA